MALIQTAKGLPNTCSICGKKITTQEWYARNEDDARAGLGGHKKCFVDEAKAEAGKALKAAEDLESEE